MDVEKLFGPMDVSVSALKAEGQRIRLIHSNIANARTTRTAEGGPYRRKDVVFSTELDKLSGVVVSRVTEDGSPFKKVFDPAHPDADDEGFVLFPNVDLPTEMVRLMSANRAYQANIAMMKRYLEMVEVKLELLR